MKLLMKTSMNSGKLNCLLFADDKPIIVKSERITYGRTFITSSNLKIQQRQNYIVLKGQNKYS